MTRPHRLARLAALFLLMVPVAAHAQADNYPTKPVTIIADAAAGAAPDVAVRFFAEGLGRIWKQQVIVVNHPGANGSIAARAAADAPNDGYTLYTPALSTFVALPTVAPNLPVKLPRDFLPIGFTAEQPMFIAVDPALGVNTLPELIARAKQEPDKLSIASSGVGRLTHLTGELLQMRAGVRMVSVPYPRGISAALSDVGSGRVSTIIENYSGIAGAAKAGQVKLIATAAPQRLPEFPDLPTVAETIPGFSATGWTVLLAPKGAPTPIIAKVSKDLTTVDNDPEIKKRLAAIGSYSRAMTPDGVLAFVAKEQETWLPVLQRTSPK
ncbi:MAG TPA: tripartite tricarboxylate transporter substrate binding protein [Xanthobacteraceae bacterium]|nr:tripartite tricarboxylate transporter substrate binding protein [Xanthobacteraceae bacterium]